MLLQLKFKNFLLNSVIKNILVGNLEYLKKQIIIKNYIGKYIFWHCYIVILFVIEALEKGSIDENYACIKRTFVKLGEGKT